MFLFIHIDHWVPKIKVLNYQCHMHSGEKTLFSRIFKKHCFCLIIILNQNFGHFFLDSTNRLENIHIYSIAKLLITIISTNQSAPQLTKSYNDGEAIYVN